MTLIILVFGVIYLRKLVRKRWFYSVILCDTKISLFDTNVYFSGS